MRSSQVLATAAAIAGAFFAAVGAFSQDIADWIVSTDSATWLEAAQTEGLTAEPVPESPWVRFSLDEPGTEPVMLQWTWGLGGAHDDGRYTALEYRSAEWHGSTFWSGPDWTRVGKNWQHPGTHTPSVRTFRAPMDGEAVISGTVRKGDTSNGGGEGVVAAIRHNRTTLWEGTLAGDDDTGHDISEPVSLREGDAIRFVVRHNGAITYGTTEWDPCIAYADGTRFLASEGFSTSGQGEHGWLFEMETLPNAPGPKPTVYGFTPEMGLIERPLDTDRAASLDHFTSVPAFVIADPASESGCVVVLPGEPVWRAVASLSESGVLSLLIELLPLKGQRREHECELFLRGYEGHWLEGIAVLDRIADTPTHPELDAVRRSMAQRTALGILPETDLALSALTQQEWRREDGLDGSRRAFVAAIESHRGLTERLLDDFGADVPEELRHEVAAVLKRASEAVNEEILPLEMLETEYLGVRALKRRVALANPLMQFGPMLFCKRVPTSYSHLVMQYFGWRARPGGSLFILERPGYSLDARDILEGQLAGGNILEPRLSYDARKIVFSYVECIEGEFDINSLNNTGNDGFYHIYEVNVDGTGLRQLTDGPFDDLMPTYLPDGGIAFSSTRRKGYARCFGAQFSPRWHVYTLHRLEGDGSNIRTLSWHDTNEWFPAVCNTGRILYSRWDYIDRDAVTHQNVWATRPDGTNPIAVWGNATPNPHCAFQLQPIPGSNKIVFTASAHHSITAGSIVVLDPSVDTNAEAALTRITPEVPFPESETWDIPEYYAAPWPLSESYFLTAYSPTPLVWEPGANKRNALGIYLIDAFGNRELLYRDPDIGATNPCPLRSRPVPPVVPSQLPEAPPDTGEMALADVYEGLGDVPRGTIKELRIVQIFPKLTVVADKPPVGIAREENARAILGTVPVEEDGSAYFTVPARKPILFQALDENGYAYQTMRTITYVQPGERVSCVGCHENRMSAPPRGTAFERPPSAIQPEEFGTEPFAFPVVVQPVLDRHCVTCHGGDEPEGGINLTGTPHNNFSKAYWSLCGDVDFWGEGTNPENAAKALVPRFGARNQIQVTPPGGQYGARGSLLLAMLRDGHNDVELEPHESRRLAAWIDANAVFHGAYTPERQQMQMAGEPIGMPPIE